MKELHFKNQYCKKEQLLFFEITAIRPTGWVALLERILAEFQEVEEIRFGFIQTICKDSTENQKNSGEHFYLMAVYLNSWTPGYRMRELHLLLNRFFSKKNELTINIAIAVDNGFKTKYENFLSPCRLKGILQKMKFLGELLYRISDRKEDERAA